MAKIQKLEYFGNRSITEMFITRQYHGENIHGTNKLARLEILEAVQREPAS
jgi:hypothetical protein